MEELYKCYNCGKVFREEDWTPNENGELAYVCPDCGTVWYKEETAEDESENDNKQ